ncbi:MAG: ubiquinone/menaquinone biosynthesis methyltransferase [Thermoplasmata archaeon]
MNRKEDGRLAGYRPGSLRKMFREVSDRYDLLNRILTFRLDLQWRMHAARSCLEDSPKAVLDLCCGTGNLLFAILKHSHDGARILGVDFTEAMIEKAGSTAGKSKPLIIADAGLLPLKDESFDCVATAFSFRNLLYKNPRLDSYLSEVVRILRPGGKFLILETSQPEQEALRRLYNGYLRLVVPFVGGLISGSRGAYTYLSKSALDFPASDEITRILRGAGFRKVTFEPLFFGVVGIHTSKK